MIPTFYGAAAGARLRERYGVPNVAPRSSDILDAFRTRRVLFVDDDTGEPVAYWQPTTRREP